VLIADDAVVVRKILTDVLGADPELEVVGVAANGKIALAKIAQVNPDVVLLDVEMPEMDGLEAVAAIRKISPLLPVIMFSTLTERGAVQTLEALARGATDYVTKPANVGSVALAQQRIRDELIPKIKFYGRKGAKPTALSAKGAPPAKAPSPPARAMTSWGGGRRVTALVIGVSTGGPNALAELMPVFPQSFPVPVLIVQHMPPLFTKFLADRLDKSSALEVREGQASLEVKPGQAWIAPGDYHMTVAWDRPAVRLHLHQGPPENSCRPAVDVLFRSAAEVFGSGVLAVVLTGMGQDGLWGCEAIREAGGQVIAQDEATSVVWGMPGAVVRAGLAQRILPLNQIGPEIVRRVTSSSPAVAAGS
jgi:two-component system chemotaxis response regulator CheB